MTRVSVVIPCYNGWDLTHQLLLDVYKKLRHDVEVVVVDDCSTQEEVSKGLMWWKTGIIDGQLRVFVNEKNSGFLRTANFGVSKATGEVVMLISNDVRIYGRDVTEKVLDVFEHAEVPTLAGNRLLNGNTGWNTFNDRVYPYLEGWFLAFKRDEWLKFGGFDERYKPYDFEDVDISTTYLANGGKLVNLDVDMVHLGAQTYKYSPEREAQTKRNQKKFEDKWVAK
jgi:GT2 family glycosyltransferase